jgi:cation transporter-like permease
MVPVSRAWFIIVSHLTLIGVIAGKDNNNILLRRGKSFNEEISQPLIRGRRGKTRTATSTRTTSSRHLIETQEDDSNEELKLPFLVSLMDASYNHVCGGTLIAKDIILTAASCQDEE